MKDIAIIIGIGSYNDLGVIRSCGEQNISCVYITNQRKQIIPIYKSRYLLDTRYVEFTNENIFNEIITIKKKYKSRIVVYPTSDNAVVILDILHSKMPESIYVPHAKGNMGILMDKLEMSKIAIEAGLEVPTTVSFNITDNENKLEGLEFPIIAKPVKSIDGEKSDIAICDAYSDLKGVIKNYHNKGYRNILIQKYIHDINSKEIGITGISYKDGTIEIHGYIDKIRNRSNINNFGVYYPNEEISIKDSLKEYIRKTGYVGIFDTDFIKSDGKYYFLECNFRNGAYGYAVTHAGFNMPVLWFNDCINKRDSTRTKLRKTVFMEERTDFLNVLDKTFSLSSWLRDVLNTNVFLFWNRKDIGPMIRIPYFVKKIFKHR